MGWFSSTKDKIELAVENEVKKLKDWINTKISVLTTKIGSVQTDVAFLEGRVKELEDKIEDLIKKLEGKNVPSSNTSTADVTTKISKKAK